MRQRPTCALTCCTDLTKVTKKKHGVRAHRWQHVCRTLLICGHADLCSAVSWRRQGRRRTQHLTATTKSSGVHRPLRTSTTHSSQTLRLPVGTPAAASRRTAPACPPRPGTAPLSRTPSRRPPREPSPPPPRRRAAPAPTPALAARTAREAPHRTDLFFLRVFLIVTWGCWRESGEERGAARVRKMGAAFVRDGGRILMSGN